ncbi:MAG: hypothetical protein HOV80_12880, partial [Polyangiaceae bacterium]|nr:hypothetical protein [Polyangiaceae bacterium]
KPTDPGKSAATPAPAATSAGPKRLNKTLEIDTKLTEKALDRSKPQPPSPPKKNEAPTVAAKQEIVPPPVDAKVEAKADKKKDSVAPAADTKAAKFTKDSNTGTITTIRKTAEGTVIMDRPVVKKSAEGTEIMAPRPADISSLDLDDKETAERKPLKRQQTLEMELDDHTTAAEKHPESPVSVSGSKAKRDDKGKREDTGTAFQVDQEDQPTEEMRDSSSSTPPEGRRKNSALEVPLSSLIAASMVWIVGLLAFFFVGRISGFKSAGQAPVAKDGLGDKFLTWAPGPDLGGAFGPGDPKPCSVTRQPKKWASSASKSVPFDMRAEGDMALLGFAQGDREGVGLKIDPKSGKFEETFRLKVDNDVVRVSPTGTTDGFFVGVKGEKTIVPASAKSPRFVVIEKGAISASDAPDGSGASSLWTLDGEGEISAETVQRVNDDTFFLSFRRGNEVMGGYFGADKVAKGSLVRVTGSGGKVGKPRSSSNGTEVAVVFADKPAEKEDSHWEVRIGRAAIGQVPETTEEVSIPEGGPGGDVIAPDIIGMSDGRWLLMWTEGTSGERSILAQTYDKHFAPIGDPIALSPPAGSFGQAVLGVVGTYTTVAFLQAADEGFEMWGAVLQCGN